MLGGDSLSYFCNELVINYVSSKTENRVTVNLIRLLLSDNVYHREG